MSRWILCSWISSAYLAYTCIFLVASSIIFPQFIFLVHHAITVVWIEKSLWKMEEALLPLSCLNNSPSVHVKERGLVHPPWHWLVLCLLHLLVLGFSSSPRYIKTLTPCGNLGWPDYWHYIAINSGSKAEVPPTIDSSKAAHECYDQNPALTRILLHLSAGWFNFLASIAHTKIHKNHIPWVWTSEEIKHCCQGCQMGYGPWSQQKQHEQSA
jgi:hypothetical protein